MRYTIRTPVSRLKRGAALAALTLLCVSGIARAEEPAAAQSQAGPQGAAELKIYKQRFEVTANVHCKIYERRPTFCKVYVNAPITEAVQPEMILRYSGLTIGDREYDVETTEDANVRFRTGKINYSGEQTLEVDVVYIK